MSCLSACRSRCRSKTFDHSLLTQVQTEPDSKLDRKKSHYSQVSFHQGAAVSDITPQIC